MVADARILNLVTELLQGEHGEASVLKKIRRAAVQDEVISVNERTYVESLAEKFLFSGRKKNSPPPAAKPEPALQHEKPAVRREIKPPRRADVSNARRRKKSGKKIILLVVIVLAVAAASAAAAVYSLTDFTYMSGEKSASDRATEFSIETDSSSYEIGDIVSVSGYSAKDVKVSVLDSKYNIVWFDEITPVAGQYSVLIIAGGEGWDDGTYTVMASSGTNSNSVKISVG